jgi:putative tryptophan/tyrosine transport system substrate-binding protein
MRRREFVTLLGGGAAAAWPPAALAQRADRTRRIGVFMNQAADNPEGRARFAAFLEELTKLGWTAERNIRIEVRWGAGDSELYRRYAAELVALSPDVLVASGGPITQAIQRATRTVPIVFAIVPDPIGGGHVPSLARPGGNATGFMQFEFSFSGKWVELLKQMSPTVTRAAVIRNPDDPSDAAQFAVIQAVGSVLGIEVSPIDTREASEIERGITQLAGSTNGGLIVTAGRAINHYERIIALSNRHRLPAVYPIRFYVGAGGLVSYGPDLIDQYRRAAGYVDRVLRGEKPGDLPVQAPTKYELLINLKTAKALGLSVPPTLLARADEVIE